MTNVEALGHLACCCQCSGKHEERLTGNKTRRAQEYPPDLVTAVTVVLCHEKVLGGDCGLPLPPRLRWLGQALAQDKVTRANRVEPALVGTYEYPEPLQVVEMGRGYHCAVPVCIGGVKFRATLDTGAARNLIRTEFAEQLRANSKTKGSVVSRGKADRQISCIGICKDMGTATLDHVSTVSCRFESVVDGMGPPRSVDVSPGFAELKGASDPLLIGFP